MAPRAKVHQVFYLNGIDEILRDLNNVLIGKQMHNKGNIRQNVAPFCMIAIDFEEC